MGLRYTSPAIYFRESMEQLSNRANLVAETDDSVKQLLEEEMEKYPQANLFFISRGQTLSNVWHVIAWVAKDITGYRRDFPISLVDYLFANVRRYQHPAMIMVKTVNGWEYFDCCVANEKQYARAIQSKCGVGNVHSELDTVVSLNGKSASAMMKKRHG